MKYGDEADYNPSYVFTEEFRRDAVEDGERKRF